ncbi:hypothetical protein RFM52_22860 [Mesorhizobium sp. VK2B]|uniref:Uncharacterized protein n=1 Tax=Mesorhizobium humile TaxID=3072313 RepID=A0ABU4YM00_9HYPH|nr:hypothetical protein [Mesorhizobium sp. VK2B]
MTDKNESDHQEDRDAQPFAYGRQSDPDQPQCFLGRKQPSNCNRDFIADDGLLKPLLIRRR